MPFFVGTPEDLAWTGPLVAVRLCAPECVKSDAPPIDALAEIDTSSIMTVIQEGVATSLGLKPVKRLKIPTFNRPVYEGDVYMIRLQFPEGNAIETPAIEVPYMLRDKVRIKCLIGRYVLKQIVFTYNGFTNTFSLTF
jgi:hypothetical protein